MTNTYDLIRYPSWPIVNTHPARIAACAALLGRSYVPFARSRVLEIGCGDGINLMSLALTAPEAEFVGIDLAEAPIAYGRALARSVGLSNLRLEAQDITCVGDTLGPFDYIIAHGVYAWVPEFVQQAILDLIGQSLSPEGLAFVSYNVDPGCRVRQVLRDLMHDRLKGIDGPAEKIKAAHETLHAFIDVWDDADAFQLALKTEAQDMLKRPPALLFHDELGSFYLPQRLSTVSEAARSRGLEYLCDTRSRDIGDMLQSAESHETSEWIALEQTRDFAEMRRFRQSILCRASGPIPRSFTPNRLEGLFATAALTPTQIEGSDGFGFRTAKGDEFEVGDPRLGAFLSDLGACFPAALPCADFIDQPELSEALIALFAKDIIELSAAALPYATEAGDRPLASPLARAQIAEGERVLASLRHKPVRLEDPTARYLLSLLDGTTTRRELADAIAKHINILPTEALVQVEAALTEFVKLGLLESR